MDAMVGQRLIPEEHMNIIMSFGITSECNAAFEEGAKRAHMPFDSLVK